MDNSWRGLLARRHGVVLAVVLACVVVVAVWGYLTPKRWEAATTIRLEPRVVPGLRQGGAPPVAPSEEEAFAADLAAARSADFQTGLAGNGALTYDLTVEGDADAGTLTFLARSDTAERATASSFSAANGFIAWGRAQEAVGRRFRLEEALADLAPGDPAAARLEARIEAATEAIDVVDATGGVVVAEPVVPRDPASPDLAARLIVALVAGLLLGLAVAWWVDRRAPAPTRSPAVDAQPPARSRGAPARALAVVAVAALALPLASVLALIVDVWELRPSSNAQDELAYSCFATFLEPIPDGTAVRMSPDTARFFHDHLQEFAFPRLEVAYEGRPAEVEVRVAPGRGPNACGNLHAEIADVEAAAP